MARRKDRSPPPTATTLTLHLGDESRQHLERCRQLLEEPSAHGEPLTLGRVVRLIVRRQLLSLLGERADWTNPACPISAEYLAVRTAQMREEAVEQLRRAASHPIVGPVILEDQSSRPSKGGGS